MEFRDATPSDAGTIRSVARESLSASYAPALDDETIETAVEQWYTRENIERAVEEEETMLVLAVDGDEILGFTKGGVVGRREPVGEIHWLHVAPEHRGRGIGARLLDQIQTGLEEVGAERFAGFVLDVNEAGGAFYERHGYTETGSRDIEIGDTEFRELEFGRRSDTEGAGASPLQPVSVDGATRYVAYDEGEQGSLSPFYPLYNDRDRETQYAYLCSNCEAADVAVNSMGGYECNTCANRHKPSRWDAAYL